MVDVAEWFNDFVSVTEAGVSEGPPKGRGQRRLSHDSAGSGPDPAGKAERLLSAAAGKQRGCKRKAADDCDADSERTKDQHVTAAVATEDGATGSAGHMKRRKGRASAALTLKANCRMRGQHNTGSIDGLHRIDSDKAAADSHADARDEEGVTSQRPHPYILPAWCYAVTQCLCTIVSFWSVPKVIAPAGARVEAGHEEPESHMLAPARRGRRQMTAGKGVRQDSPGDDTDAQPKVHPWSHDLPSTPTHRVSSSLACACSRCGCVAGSERGPYRVHHSWG